MVLKSSKNLTMGLATVLAVDSLWSADKVIRLTPTTGMNNETLMANGGSGAIEI